VAAAGFCVLNKPASLIPNEFSTFGITRKFGLDEAPKLIEIPYALYPSGNERRSTRITQHALPTKRVILFIVIVPVSGRTVDVDRLQSVNIINQSHWLSAFHILEMKF
jgi:hypothetical protein